MFTLHHATPDDAPFERAIYDSTRAAELDAWGWPEAQREAFLEVQFRAQRAFFSGRSVRIAEVGGEPAARVVTEQAGAGLRLIDIAVLPVFRGRGLGTALVRALQAEASPIVLEARRDRPAVCAWYRGLGFRVVGRGALHERLSWTEGPDRRGVIASVAVGAAALGAAPSVASARTHAGDTELRVTPLSIEGIHDAELRARTPAGPRFIVWGLSMRGDVVSAGAASQIRIPFEGAPELEVHVDGQSWVVRLRHRRSDVHLDGRWPRVRKAGERLPDRPAIRIERV